MALQTPLPFVNFESVDEIETVVGLPAVGWVFFYDGNGRLKKMSIENFNNLLKALKPLGIGDPAPTEIGMYKPKTAGTYANADGLTAEDGFYTLFFFDGTNWSKTTDKLPQASNNIRRWEDLQPSDFPLVGYQQVVKDSSIYELPQGITAESTDVPGVSAKWKKINKADSVLSLTSSNAIENKVLAKIVKDTYQKPTAFYNHITSQTYQDSGTSAPTGNSYGFSSGIITASSSNIFPAGTYTLYIKYRIISKDNLGGISFFNGTVLTRTTSASNLTNGETYEEVFTITKSADVSSGNFLQVRTQYPASVAMNANFEIIAMQVFTGAKTVSEVNDVYNKVKNAELADRATLADRLSTTYIDTVSSFANKITASFPTGLVNYNATTPGVVTDSYYLVENGILKAGGKIANYSGTTGGNRMWYGIDFQPSLYATEAKSYYVVMKGRAKTKGVRNLTYVKSSASSPSATILQDMTDDVWTDFTTVAQVDYSVGYTGNQRYTYTDYVVYSQNTPVQIDLEFSVFGVVEKNAFTSQLTNDELVQVMLGTYEVLKKEKLPKDVVYQSQLTAFQNNFKIPLGAENLKSDFDITMIIGYGQSLAVGTGASSSSVDFKNTLSFAGGVSLYTVPFSTTAEKNAFYGSGFQKLSGRNVQYPPATASVLAMIQLINSENLVDLGNYGLEFLPMTGGVSGGPISSMNKGTTAYNNLLEVIAKAKEFANAQGKTFGVSVLNWNQGEGDRTVSQVTYYNALKQLFTDFNTDIKAITGQTKDVIFITYQTSAWAGVWYPSGQTTQQSGDTDFNMPLGVQKAQEQLASEEANVYMCGAMYQFIYSDFFHPADRANVGLQMGVAAKRILNDGKDFPTFKPISHSLVGNFIHLKFSAPVLPIRFDVSGDAFHNPRGKQTNFGFKVLNSSGTDIINAEPYIVRGDTVVIPCSTSPIGSTIKYAENGHYGGGNLCDSQGIVVNNKNQNYVIDNFAISFDNYNI